jgi:hypothetical protein
VLRVSGICIDFSEGVGFFGIRSRCGINVSGVGGNGIVVFLG